MPELFSLAVFLVAVAAIVAGNVAWEVRRRARMRLRDRLNSTVDWQQRYVDLAVEVRNEPEYAVRLLCRDEAGHQDTLRKARSLSRAEFEAGAKDAYITQGVA